MDAAHGVTTLPPESLQVAMPANKLATSTTLGVLLHIYDPGPRSPAYALERTTMASPNKPDEID